MRRKSSIVRLFRRLEATMGPQHWWPAGSAFEVVVGAYLTQNTAWTNVEQAMKNLREAGVLSASGIRKTPVSELELLVRPAGYFRQKAARLKLFVEHLDRHYEGSLNAMFARSTGVLRDELLELPGIGPETADSILLYAGGHEVFVVDTYTRRIFERHRLTETDARYDEIRLAVERALTRESGSSAGDSYDPEAKVSAAVIREQITIHEPSAASQMRRSDLSQIYNEFHALLVQTAKHYCVKGTPKCEACPLRSLLPQAQ